MSNVLGLHLEGDGVNENLFHFLWAKDEHDQGPPILIPDTVIFKFVLLNPPILKVISLSSFIKKGGIFFLFILFVKTPSFLHFKKSWLF